MGKYDERYDSDHTSVKSRSTSDGYTTIIDHKSTGTYTSIHEGENRETVVDSHYSDGSRTVDVFDNSSDLNHLRQIHYDKDGNRED